MRILVCGGRDYEDSNAVHLELTRFHWRIPITVLIHGGVSGAGVAAEAWARRNSIDVVRYPPNWERFGKKAEGLRNTFMLADSRPDSVMAFPGGRHTADLVEKAVAARIPVFRVACTRVGPALGSTEDAVQQADNAGAHVPKTSNGAGCAGRAAAEIPVRARH